MSKHAYVRRIPPGAIVLSSLALWLSACGGDSEGGDRQLSAPAPASMSLAATTVVSWTACAQEYGTCSVSGTREVRYGANGKYVTRTVSGSVACSNEVFGDPAPGADKVCEYAGSSGAGSTPPAAETPTPPSSAGTAGSWSRCAAEDGICSFAGTLQVRYGLNGSYAYRTATASIACNNNAFGGDPLPGADKFCDYAGSAPAAAVVTGRSIVEYYGDSTVWGYKSGSGSQVAKPAPAAFAEALPNPSAFEVRNEGVNGSTACGLLAGSDGRHPAWPTQMANSKARYVLINHAINDQWAYDVAAYKSCLTSLARGAKQYGKRMIFETPNPTRDSGSGGLDVYVNAMKQVAAQEGVAVIDQYKYLSDYLQGASPYAICPDGLHPREDVYLLKGRYAAKVFASLVE